MNLGTLVSETRNPQTMDLDALSTPELVKRFNEQDTLVAEAVKATLPDVARAVDAAAAALKSGGRIIYMGRAPVVGLAYWMPQNAPRRLAFRTVWSSG